MPLLRKATAIFDRTLDLLYWIASIILGLIVLIIIIEITIRTFFGRPIMGTIEIIQYGLLFITFLGAAWLLREDGHIKMDIVLSLLRPRAQAFLNIIMSIVCAIICLVVTWYGVKVTWYCYQINYRAISELEIPLVSILFVIPVGSFLLFIQFLRKAYGYLGSWRATSGKKTGAVDTN
jgi:TRAP-type C4-dicarboxylate transport system permease small subunit